MKIGIVGGGPAGLFFARLMMKDDPTHDIRIIERDPDDATYGWGVVFSDVALAFVRDVDDELYPALLACQEVHPEMLVRYRGESVTLANNTFHRMARLDLLKVLRRHSLDVGVHIEYGRSIREKRDLEVFADCDLIVAADGANSTVARLHGEHFQTSFDVRPNKLAWYGTTQRFDPLSLIFREHRDGLLIAHAYRYSRTHSTFLVECDPETFAAAGLGRMSDDESRAYCAEVFREDLDGHPLLSNNSNWFNYAIVKNRRWHHGNIVLLGDALRTGHPSIGSGTRLAMQDSIALFNACRTKSDDVPAILAEFELRRRPGSDELQAAAIRSSEWYEALPLALDPVSFAYSYMMRTGRVSHDELKRRDPQLATAFEARNGAPTAL